MECVWTISLLKQELWVRGVLSDSLKSRKAHGPWVTPHSYLWKLDRYKESHNLSLSESIFYYMGVAFKL